MENIKDKFPLGTYVVAIEDDIKHVDRINSYVEKDDQLYVVLWLDIDTNPRVSRPIKIEDFLEKWEKEKFNIDRLAIDVNPDSKYVNALETIYQDYLAKQSSQLLYKLPFINSIKEIRDFAKAEKAIKDLYCEKDKMIIVIRNELKSIIGFAIVNLRYSFTKASIRVYLDTNYKTFAAQIINKLNKEITPILLEKGFKEIYTDSSLISFLKENDVSSVLIGAGYEMYEDSNKRKDYYKLVLKKQNVDRS